MSLHELNWTREDLNKTRYEGKYVAHFNVNKKTIKNQLEPDYTDIEFKEHKLYFNDKEMDVRLDATQTHISFFYDEKFEEEFVDQQHNIQDVMLYFLTPETYRNQMPELWNQDQQKNE